MADIGINRFVNSLSANLEPPVRKHLKNVYATVAIAAICAGAGGYTALYSSVIGAGLMTSLGAIATLFGLLFTPDDGKNQVTRLSLLSVFAFLSGCNLSPLLGMAILINPAIIMEALLGTACVFACFSLAALYAPRGQYLYLGGSLMAVLSTLFWLSILNIFIGSRLLFQAHLYISLAVMCGFVVYDTQAIIEKKRRGSNDFIMHGLELFLDFIMIFKKLLIILTDKEANRQRGNNNKRR